MRKNKVVFGVISLLLIFIFSIVGFRFISKSKEKVNFYCNIVEVRLTSLFILKLNYFKGLNIYCWRNTMPNINISKEETVLALKYTVNRHKIRMMKFKKVEKSIFLYFSSFKFLYKTPLNLMWVSLAKNAQSGWTIPAINIIKSIIKDIQ